MNITNIGDWGDVGGYGGGGLMRVHRKKNAFVFWNENEISMLPKKFSTSCLDFPEKGKRVRGRKRELKS